MLIIDKLIGFLEKTVVREFKNTNYSEIKASVVVILWTIFIGIFLDQLLFSDFILILTLGSILWYSFETRKLKIETRRQLEPIIFFTTDQKGDNLKIINSGKTPAFNIKILPIKVGEDKFEFNILDPIYCLNSNEERPIKITISNRLSRTHNQNIESLRISMLSNGSLEKYLTIKYDTCFREEDSMDFVFDVSSFMVDEDDPVRACRIYPVFKDND